MEWKKSDLAAVQKEDSLASAAPQKDFDLFKEDHQKKASSACGFFGVSCQTIFSAEGPMISSLPEGSILV